MDETTIEIVMQMRDEATAQMQAFGSEVQQVGASTKEAAVAGNTPMVTMGETLAKNRGAIRELAMGTSYLGSSMMGMGIAMEMTNNSALKSTGSVLAMVGGIMTAVGSSVQFIGAISKMVDALKKLQIAEMVTQAFSGPAGWVTLAAGAAVAGAAVYGINRYESSQAKANKAQERSNGGNTYITVQGSVIKENEMYEKARQHMVKTGQRNNTTAINVPN